MRVLTTPRGAIMECHSCRYFAGDHALLDMSSMIGLQAKQVTVRTKSRESQSGDSVPTPIPVDLLKGRVHANATVRVSLALLLHSNVVSFLTFGSSFLLNKSYYIVFILYFFIRKQITFCVVFSD